MFSKIDNITRTQPSCSFSQIKPKHFIYATYLKQCGSNVPIGIPKVAYNLQATQSTAE